LPKGLVSWFGADGGGSALSREKAIFRAMAGSELSDPGPSKFGWGMQGRIMRMGEEEVLSEFSGDGA